MGSCLDKFVRFYHIFPQRVALKEPLLLLKSPYCGRHVSHMIITPFFLRSTGNINDAQLNFFSQRLLVKLHGDRATIKVYYAVSQLPFGASRQPKYVRFYLL